MGFVSTTVPSSSIELDDISRHAPVGAPAPIPAPVAKEPRERLLSLDVFRGLTIAGMLLVNNPGTWSSIYPPLEHATWNGWTPTDLIFPFFLFIVGVAITLALGRRVEDDGSKRDLYLKIIRRSLIIYALGTFLAWFPFYNF